MRDLGRGCDFYVLQHIFGFIVTFLHFFLAHMKKKPYLCRDFRVMRMCYAVIWCGKSAWNQVKNELTKKKERGVQCGSDILDFLIKIIN